MRATSIRTIANQLARVHEKLGVSGRMELLSALVGASTCKRPPTPVVLRSVTPALRLEGALAR
jgi:hypothetical protein